MENLRDVLAGLDEVTAQWILDVDQGNELDQVSMKPGMHAMELSSSNCADLGVLGEFAHPTLFSPLVVSGSCVWGEGWSLNGLTGAAMLEFQLLASARRTRFVISSSPGAKSRFIQSMELEQGIVSLALFHELDAGIGCWILEVHRSTGKILNKNIVVLTKRCQLCGLCDRVCNCPDSMIRLSNDFMHPRHDLTDSFLSSVTDSSHNGSLSSSNGATQRWMKAFEGNWTCKTMHEEEFPLVVKFNVDENEIEQFVELIKDYSSRSEATSDPSLHGAEDPSSSWGVPTYSDRSLQNFDYQNSSNLDFQNSSNLDHQNSPTGNGRSGAFVCTICGKRFSRGYDMRRHNDSVHKRLKLHPCVEPGCPKTFNQRSHMKDHWHQMHGERRYKCTETHLGKPCEKTFGIHHRLTRHIESVHKGRRFICDVCNEKSYREKSHMNKHRRTCTGGSSKRLIQNVA